MAVLAQQIEKTLLPGMHLPEPLRALFQWIETNGFYIDRPGGERIGFLFPEEELRKGWTDTKRPGGTTIEFFAEGNVNMKYWFGHERPEMLSRLCVFAKTGGEGSMAAFWLDPQGEQKIVHMGSGSGSTMVCVLADDPIDFLRLLAVGYDEICWDDQLGTPPNTDPNAGIVVHPNIAFQAWVHDTFQVTIPKVATEIVRYPESMGDDEQHDPFNQWVTALRG